MGDVNMGGVEGRLLIGKMPKAEGCLGSFER